MKKETIVRAWKDPEFRAQLTEEERALLPDLPAGVLELDDDLLKSASLTAGASEGFFCSVSGECWGFSCNPWYW